MDGNTEIEGLNLKVEELSIELVELMTAIQGRSKEAEIIIGLNLDLQDECITTFCDTIDHAVDSASQLIHFIQEVASEQESCARLAAQIQCINNLLNSVEKYM